jgi:hypothetical protein
MKSLLLVLALLLPAMPVVAHELTPTYPKLKPSYVEGLLVAQLTMFNARKDVDYYEIGVFDVDFRPIPFAAANRILKAPTGQRVTFDVYIRRKDETRAVYVCTLSKLKTDESSNAVVSSKVCSRLDGGLP